MPNLKPDMIILDISIGDLNGFEITRRLKANKCSSKIIFLTVHEEFEFVRAAFDAGALGYVFKSRLSSDLRTGDRSRAGGKDLHPGGANSAIGKLSRSLVVLSVSNRSSHLYHLFAEHTSE